MKKITFIELLNAKKEDIYYVCHLNDNVISLYKQFLVVYANNKLYVYTYDLKSENIKQIKIYDNDIIRRHVFKLIYFKNNLECINKFYLPDYATSDFYNIISSLERKRKVNFLKQLD